MVPRPPTESVRRAVPGGSVLVDQKSRARLRLRHPRGRRACRAPARAPGLHGECGQGKVRWNRYKATSARGGPQGLLGEPRRDRKVFDIGPRVTPPAAASSADDAGEARTPRAAPAAAPAAAAAAAPAAAPASTRSSSRRGSAPSGGRGDGGGHQVRREDHQRASCAAGSRMRRQRSAAAASARPPSTSSPNSSRSDETVCQKLNLFERPPFAAHAPTLAFAAMSLRSGRARRRRR